MHILTYDHSFEGFLSAVFEVYEFKLNPVQIRREGLANTQLFTNVRRVYTDNRKSERVYNKLKELVGDIGIHRILYSLLSEDEEAEEHLLTVIKYALDTKTNIIKDYAHPAVLKLSQYEHMVHREKHRMEAFVRFKLTRDHIYFAEIEPDCNVLPIIAKHFKSRYQDQQWLIFDNKRHYGIFYDLKSIEIMSFDSKISDRQYAGHLTEEEHLYQKLWKTYFDKTNIKARKNTRLHVQHVPKRYWKYLTEKMVL